jgi:tetraacyldisaccharide 4'-kinase
MNPLSGLYGAVVAARNVLFDRGIFPAHRLDRPVVSVGNVSMGGAGKTPFVIALGQVLKTRGVSFDVLSRGYGRKTRGVRVVDPNGSAAEFGDEPLLISRTLDVPVIVGERRYDAGLVAEQQFHSNLHLLDDGFQHRSLARNFEIVLVTKDDLEDRLLPLGRLREPLSSLGRADAIIVPAGAHVDRLEMKGKPIFRMTRSLQLLQPPQSPVVFCGLARPDQFFAQVRAAGVTSAAEVAFQDHHAYTALDIERLLAMKTRLAAGGFVTTAKDAINLGSLQARPEPLTVAGLEITLDRWDELVNAILANEPFAEKADRDSRRK